MTEASAATYGPSALATPANAVSIVRMVLAVPLLVFVVRGEPSYVATLGWAVLAISDGVDGFLARRQGTTRSGAFLDPLADKVLVLGAGWALVLGGTFWWLPVALITAREIGISALRSWYGRRGLAIPARYSAKVKTVVQELSIGLALLPPTADQVPWLASAVLWGAVALTLWSGVGYVLDGRGNLSRTGDRT